MTTAMFAAMIIFFAFSVPIAVSIGIDQAFFDNTAAVYDPTAAGSARAVNIGDLRSYSAGVYFFPLKYGNLRPYAGLGLSINVIQNDNRAEEVAEVDAALLTDDLPPAAYADPGFMQFLNGTGDRAP